MKIISCASYYGTGSSAITDLLSEYDDIMGLTDYEFRFLQDPGGIRELEFHLVENHNRHTSGHALKTYKKLVENLGNSRMKKYEFFFHGQWKTISYAYIEGLTDFCYKGYWHQDVIDRGKWFHFRKRLWNKILKNTIWKNQPEVSLNELPKEITYCSHPTEEKFLQCTRQYIDELFAAANLQNAPSIMVDQIVPPTNLNHYIRYFNDIKVFLVERDPRDIYLSEKYIWRGRIVPTEDVELFCKWYEYTRNHRKYDQLDKEKIMFITFEDLVYCYDESVKKVEDWLGISAANHVAPKTAFIPEKSKANTRIWEKLPNVDEEAAYIRQRLSQYLYPYEGVTRP